MIDEHGRDETKPQRRHSSTYLSLGFVQSTFLFKAPHTPVAIALAPPGPLLSLPHPTYDTCSVLMQSKGASTQSLFNSMGGKKAAAAAAGKSRGRRGSMLLRLPKKQTALLFAVVLVALVARFGSAHAPSLTEVGVNLELKLHKYGNGTGYWLYLGRAVVTAVVVVTLTAVPTSISSTSKFRTGDPTGEKDVGWK